MPRRQNTVWRNHPFRLRADTTFGPEPDLSRGETPLNDWAMNSVEMILNLKVVHWLRKLCFLHHLVMQVAESFLQPLGNTVNLFLYMAPLASVYSIVHAEYAAADCIWLRWSRASRWLDQMASNDGKLTEENKNFKLHTIFWFLYVLHPDKTQAHFYFLHLNMYTLSC